MFRHLGIQSVTVLIAGAFFGGLAATATPVTGPATAPRNSSTIAASSGSIQRAATCDGAGAATCCGRERSNRLLALAKVADDN